MNHLSSIRFFSLPLLVVSLGLALLPSMGQAQFDYISRYNTETLEVRIFLGDMEEEIILIREEDGEIIFRPRGARIGAEIGRPLEEIRNVHFQLPRSFTRAWEQVREEPEKALEGMRPFVYALNRYQHFRSGNLFPILNEYLNLLIRLDQTAEALYFIRNTRLQYASAEFMNTVLAFTQKLVQEERQSDAVTILNRIPFSLENLDLLEVVLEFANDLRRRERFVEANFLYARLIGVEGNPFLSQAVLWHVFGDVKLQRPAAAQVFLNRYYPEPPDSMNQEYSLYLLIRGLINRLQEREQDAIMDITRSVVFAPLDAEWTAELFYLVGGIYEQRSNRTARDIYEQIRLFYPNSPFADRAYDRLVAIVPGFLESQREAEPADDEDLLLMEEDADDIDIEMDMEPSDSETNDSDNGFAEDDSEEI